MKLVLFSFLFLPYLLVAQSWGPSKVKAQNKVFLEFQGGAMFSDLIYTGSDFKNQTSSFYLGHTEGVAMRAQINQYVSAGALVSYRSEGEYLNDLQLSVNPRFLNFYVPIEFDFAPLNKVDKSKPSAIVFGGPYVAYNLGGFVKGDDVNFEITTNEFNSIDFGAEAGVGLRIPVFSMEGRSNLNLRISYFRGFVNSTVNTSISSKPDIELLQVGLSNAGSRNNSGIRLSVGYELSFVKRKMTTFTAGGNGKRTYKKFVNIK